MVKLLRRGGFTMLELMIVIAIIGILASLAQPMYRSAVKKGKEAALKENLHNMRNVIDQYYADNGSYPGALTDLVDKGYLRGVPKDPFTNSNETWVLVYATETDTATGSEESSTGIFDVKSSSGDVGTDGKAYSEW